MKGENQKSIKLNIFSVIDNEKYEKYLLPFIFLPLYLNKDVSVEVHLATDYSKWREKNVQAVELLQNWFSDRFLIKQLKSEFWEVLSCGSTARFYTEPTLQSKWVKISDVDILHIESHLSRHYERIEQSTTILENHPYLALKRKGENKLSGTMCVLKNSFYTQAWKQNRKKYFAEVVRSQSIAKKIPPFDQPYYYHDEFVNWDLVVPVHGHPSSEMSKHPDVYRPIQGIHISPNRPAYAPAWQPDRPDWGITDELKGVWREIIATEKYQEISKFFDPEMTRLINHI